MKVLSYRIYLEQPLLATQILGDPNSSVSFPYIPGSLVRGMLVHRYRQGLPGPGENAVARDEVPTEDGIALDQTCRRLFFSGATRYLNAYPLAAGGRRSLPTPRALLRRKEDPEEEAKAFNGASPDFDREAAESGDTLKAFSSPFCLLDADQLILCAPQPNRLTVHVAREPKKGRATADGGAIFQYEALSAGQWFGGVVLVDNDEDAATIKQLLPGSAWLGRSRSAGYGRVRIEVDREPANPWREIDGPTLDLPAGQPVTLTLLSDAILRDGSGAYALTLDQAILEAYLGVKIADLRPEHSFSTNTLNGGFNRTAEAPLPQSYSVAAGSTITFTLASPLDAAAVADLETRGIGERRAEGYGRVAFNWLTEEQLEAVHDEAYNVQATARGLSAASRAMARQMARHLLDVEIEQRIASFTRDYVAPSALQMPANSQLGRVRVFLRRATRTGALLPTVLHELGTFQAAGRQQFERARITNTTLWEWLGGLLSNPQARDVWSEIGLPPDTWPQVAGEQALADDDLTRTVTLQLIEATLTTAARERKRREDAR